VNESSANSSGNNSSEETLQFGKKKGKRNWKEFQKTVKHQITETGTDKRAKLEQVQSTKKRRLREVERESSGEEEIKAKKAKLDPTDLTLWQRIEKGQK